MKRTLDETMEKRVEELEMERAVAENRMAQLTDEFNKINEIKRMRRAYPKKSFTPLDALASEEEKENYNNAIKEYIQELENDIVEIRSMNTEIEYAIEEINQPDQVVDLEIGGKAFVYNGFDNGGSTGYQWSVEISDESIVKCMRTSGQGKDTSYLCGGGRDFGFMFYAVRPGT